MAGSQRALAAACKPKYSQNAIHQARKVGRISPRLAIAIERALGGAIPREELCPDLQ